MTPNETFFGLITAAIIALVIFLIWLIMRVGETMKTTNRVLETMDQNFREAMGEVNQNLISLRAITNNIGTVTNDVASFSGSIKDIGDEVRQLTGSVKRIGDMVHDVGTEAVASACGLRAGFRTGFDVFLRNLFQQRTSK
jgi:uncharacterized protein YoxC